MTNSILTTQGVSSSVSGDRDGDRQHVGLLDVDDAAPMSVHQAASQMDGFCAVYRSSDGSHHIWMLRPFESLDDALLWALDWQIVDADHIQQSQRRGSFVLRTDAKRFDSGETYKPAPKLVCCADTGDGPVSEAHYKIVEQHGDRDSQHVPNVGSDRLVGDGTLTVHKYMTVTDAAKGEI